MNEIYKTAIEAAVAAGKRIMHIYQEDDLGIIQKEDNSPLTIADKASNDIINAALVPSGIPIISEENEEIPYQERKKWSRCWIVDPLDGTKEFIKRNGEFTVNIALVENKRPKFGVIYAPALGMLYYGIVDTGKAFKLKIPADDEQKHSFLEHSEEMIPRRIGDEVRVVGSRSHMNQQTADYVDLLKQDFSSVRIISKGSSLKFCLLAEGEADIYPRFGPTMEWDTAAGQAICEAVGIRCIFQGSRAPITYNRENLLNDHFLVINEG